MKPYHTASYALYKIDHLFRTKQIDKRYRKIKYHLMTMLRHEITSSVCPPFESKKCVKYCDDILRVLDSSDELMRLLNSAINKIDSLPFDLDDIEISKSKDFVENCLRKYR